MIAKVRSIATREFLRIELQNDVGATGRNKPRPTSGNSRAKRKQQKLFQGGGEGGAEVRGSFDGTDAGGGHRSVFVLGSALAAADDRAGVAHAAARRRGLARNKAD